MMSISEEPRLATTEEVINAFLAIEGLPSADYKRVLSLFEAMMKAGLMPALCSGHGQPRRFEEEEAFIAAVALTMNVAGVPKRGVVKLIGRRRVSLWAAACRGTTYKFRPEGFGTAKSGVEDEYRRSSLWMLCDVGGLKAGLDVHLWKRGELANWRPCLSEAASLNHGRFQ